MSRQPRPSATRPAPARPVRQKRTTAPPADQPSLTLRTYTEQLLEPTIPFVTPGPPAFVSASNLKSTRVKNVSSEGFVIVQPKLERFLTQPSDEPSLVGWRTDNPTLVPSVPLGTVVTMDSHIHSGETEMAAASFSEAGYSHPTLNGLAPGGTYYPGSWIGSPASADFFMGTDVACTGTIRIRQCNETSLGPGFVESVQTFAPGVTQSFTIAFPTSGFLEGGFAITASFTETVRLSVSWASVALERLPGILTRITSMEEALDGAGSQVADLQASLGLKCSAMSFMVSNGTSEQDRGGFIHGGWFPPGSYDQLPKTHHGLVEFLSETQAQYTKISMPLDEGMHISMPRCVFEGMEFHHPYQPVAQPVLVLVWSSTAAQDLSFTARMNFEFLTLDPSVPVIWRRPDLEELLMYMAANKWVMENCISSNDWHSSKIGKMVSKLMKDPDVRRIASQLKSTGSDFLISALMRGGAALAFA